MATIHDVAEKAGVSVTTVSRVLNNRGYISEEMRSKVFKTMEELNYQPNEIARSLLRKQSNIIGLIVPTVSHPFYSELANDIEFFAHQSGYKLLLCNSRLDPAKEREYVNMMKRNRADGIIMGSHTLEVDDYLSHPFPIVTIDRKIGENIPFVASDNYSGGELATRLLIDKGCRSIAHICGNLKYDLLSNRRTDAFEAIVSSYGVNHFTVQTDMNVFDQEQYEKMIEQLLQDHPEIDGLFATSDIIAAFVIKIGRKLGRRIPEQLRIVGYDDVKAASWIQPSLTTIRQPIREMSRLAVELIRKQLEGASYELENMLPVELIERETT